MEEKLRAFLQRYLGQGDQEDDIEMLVYGACIDGSAQDIMDYGAAHPEEPFWELLKLLRPGLYGVTQEELLADDGED